MELSQAQLQQITDTVVAEVMARLSITGALPITVRGSNGSFSIEFNAPAEVKGLDEVGSFIADEPSASEDGVSAEDVFNGTDVTVLTGVSLEEVSAGAGTYVLRFTTKTLTVLFAEPDDDIDIDATESDVTACP